MDRTNRSSCRWLRYGVLATTAIVAVIGSSGCSGARLLSRRENVGKQTDNDPDHSIAGIQGPTERRLNRSRWNQKREDLAKNGDAETKAALAQYDAAQKLYDQEEYAQAAKQFNAIARQRRDRYESWTSKWSRTWGFEGRQEHDQFSQFGDSIEEDALFMAGESHFARRQFPEAEDNYNELLKHYPSTRHLDEVTRRLFKIARHWLNFPEDVGKTGDAAVQLAVGEEAAKPNGENNNSPPPGRKPSALARVPVLPNLTDGTRPAFDTYGRGEQALRAIWLHDATGPLADDALMLAATHNLRTSNFVEAARLYTLLREQYPDSPHLRDAYLLGSHVSLASYQGAPYDGKALEDSKNLKETMLQIFPEMSPEDRAQLQHEIDELKDAEIDRLWDLVEFYQIKRLDPSVALYCYLIINRFPDSKQADMARRVLQDVEKRRNQRENSIWSRMSGKSPPQREAPAGPPATVQLPDSAEQPGRSVPTKTSILSPFLRRAEQSPQLQPIDEDANTPATAPGRASL